MTELNILAECNKLLQNKYAGMIKIYGKEISDGFKMPAFFTEIVSSGYSYESINIAKMEVAYKITYFQSLVDEVDQNEKLKEIRDLFGMKVSVGNRTLKIRDVEVDHIGERNNIMQITFLFHTIFENISKTDDTPVATELEIDIK